MQKQAFLILCAILFSFSDTTEALERPNLILLLPDDPAIDGINLLPHIMNDKPIDQAERGTLFWQLDIYKHLQRHYPKPKPYSTEVARRGRWKLLCRDGKPQELFNIEADARETNNLLAEHHELAEELAGKVRAFLAEPRRSSNNVP